MKVNNGKANIHIKYGEIGAPLLTREDKSSLAREDATRSVSFY